MFVYRREQQVEIWTPAKLNLHLELLAKRADGFHELETVMTAISLYDTLRVWPGVESDRQWDRKSAAPKTNTFSADAVQFRVRRCDTMLSSANARDAREPDHIPTGTDNLVLRAYQLICETAGRELRGRIELHKRIPSAAGLGGASSDAAAMLVAANVAWNLRWSFDRLLTLAAKLGSDVPFFLGIVGLGAGAAVCRGRGEILEPYRGLTRCHFVLVRPPQGLSTADVYRRCCVPGSPTQLTAWFTSERISASQLGRLLLNRLQPAASELTPWINRLAGQFTRLQLLGHQMSGSGTCYFGVASNASHARRAVRKLHATGMGRAFHAWNITSPKGWVAAPSRN